MWIDNYSVSYKGKGVCRHIFAKSSLQSLFSKRKTVSGAPASFCLDCVNVGKALEDAKAAQEETIKRFHFLFIICNFCFFNSDNFCLILVALLREERLGQVVGVAPGDLVAAVEQLVDKAAQLRTEAIIKP